MKNITIFASFLISILNIKKRGYSTSYNVSKKVKNSLFFNYLEEIKYIINNSNNSPLQSQEIMENRWMSIIKEKLNDKQGTN